MSGHEVYHVSSRAARLSFSGGELKMKEWGASSGYSIRALNSGRLGFAFCQDEKDVKEKINDARNHARYSVKSGFSFAPKAAFREPDIMDPSLEPDDVEALKALVDEAKEAASSKGGKPRVIATAERDSIAIENTAGFSGGYEKSAFSLYVECMHNDGYGFAFHSSKGLPSSVAEHGRKAADMALSMQKAGKPESGTYTIVMQPEALESILETLMPSLSGDWKRRKMTKLDIGEKFDKGFSLYEDGLAKGINARPFDDEGTPSERRALIETGEVKSFLYDRETAALAGIKASGACSRESFDSPPSIGASNLVIAPGSWKDLGEIGRYIEVHSAHGSHTANLTTGDIGLEVSVAYLVEKGKRKPVRGFMLSGNVFDMLSNIEAIEKKQRTYGSLIAPRIAFRGVRAVT